MTDVLFRGRVKATDREGGRLRFSWNWVVARRAELMVGRDALICGDWHLPYREFESAELAAVRFWGTALQLIVRHGGRVYQFQLPPASAWDFVLKPHPFWLGELPFSVERTRRELEPEARPAFNWLSLGVLTATPVLAWLVGRWQP